jgi:serine/threonine-protein kinase
VVSSLLYEDNLGATYSAKDPIQGGVVRLLALRTPLESAAECASQIRRDGPRLQKIAHPALVRLFASGASEDGRVLLAYEDAKGITLAEQLSGGKTMRLDALLPLLRITAEALALLYKEGFAHGLLSPGVLLLRPAGEAGTPLRLLDAGAAYFTKQGRAPLVRLETQGGAWPYVAPELWKGMGVMDARTDVYALAATTFRALSGRPPFWAKDVAGFMSAHALEPVPVMSGPDGKRVVNPEVEDVLRRALSKRREDRYATPIELVQRLTEASQSAPMQAIPGVRSPQVRAQHAAPQRSPDVRAQPLPVRTQQAAPQPGSTAAPQRSPDAAPQPATPEKKTPLYHETRPIELTQQIRHRNPAPPKAPDAPAPTTSKGAGLWIALIAVALGVGIGGLMFFLR